MQHQVVLLYTYMCRVFTTHFTKYCARFTTSHSLLSMAHGPKCHGAALNILRVQFWARKAKTPLQLTCYFSKAILCWCKDTFHLTVSVPGGKAWCLSINETTLMYHSPHITNAALLWINWYYNLQDVLPRQVRSRAVWAQDHKLYLLKYSLHTNY